jgi:hypothetical protein
VFFFALLVVKTVHPFAIRHRCWEVLNQQPPPAMIDVKSQTTNGKYLATRDDDQGWRKKRRPVKGRLDLYPMSNSI